MANIIYTAQTGSPSSTSGQYGDLLKPNTWSATNQYNGQVDFNGSLSCIGGCRFAVGNLANIAAVLISAWDGGDNAFGVQLQHLTAAQAAAVSLGAGDNSGCLYYQTDGMVGFYGQFDPSITDLKRLLTTDDLPSNPTPVVVASNKVAGVMASENLINYAIPPGTGLMYRVNANCVFRSGIGTALINVQWIDEAGNSNSANFGIALSAVGSTSSGPVNVYAAPSTNIAINVVITGSAIVDCGVYLEFVQ